MTPNPSSTAGQASDVNDEARARMVASREWVRRWLSAAPDLDPDAPEVVGTRDYENDADHTRS
jgi:acetyl-CoA acetyltransferase